MTSMPPSPPTVPPGRPAAAPARRHALRAKGRRPLHGEGRHRGATPGWTTLVVAVVAVALIATAAVAQGFPAADLRLNDGSVWVTNRATMQIGKFNDQIDELDTAVSMVNSHFDLRQDGKDVLALDQRAQLMQQLSPGPATLGTPVQLPAGAQVSLHGGTVAVVDPATGRMFVRGLGAIFAVDLVKGKPDIDLGPGGVATVGTDGTAVGVSVAHDELIRRSPDGSTDTVELPFPVRAGQVQVSMVGARAIVLDRAGGRVWVQSGGLGGGDVVKVPDARGARLQAPAAAPLPTAQGVATALVATASGLVGIMHGDAVPLTSDVTGTPIRPVVVAGCGYAAFAGKGSGTVATVCAPSGAVAAANGVRVQQIPSLPSDADLVFRVNRDVVVLNDMVSGSVWLPRQNLKLVAGWTKVAPPEQKQGDTNNDRITKRIDPNRDGPNRPPVARDDAVSARAGRSTILPILDNDSDPDGDIIAVSGDPRVTGVPGVVANRIRGGTALQVTVPAGASGVARFGYTINDGRGGQDSAQVSVTILSPDLHQQDRAPYQRPTESLTVGLGRQITYPVLKDWRDPDGDDLFLVDATAAGEDEVRFTPDGTLTYTDVGVSSGRKKIEITVSDGVKSTKGELIINVRKDRRVPPTVYGDHADALVGQTITVSPLDNDLGTNLNLSRVQLAQPGPTIRADYDAGTFTFVAHKAGSYYVQYLVDNGQRDFGIVRIDVTNPPKTNRPPVAVRDTALLPPGGSVLVDPLANDEDPDGDVLALQSVGADPAVKIKMIQRHLLQITDASGIDGPIQLTYQVSDGRHSVPGTLVLAPAPAGHDRRPDAEPDQLTVRAGSTGRVRVLHNDSSPAGLALTVDRDLAEQPAAGTAWVDGEYVRYAAPATAGEYSAVYQIHDSEGHTASAQVRFTVVGANVTNSPPVARPVVGRVLAGTTIKIIIPVDGVDPDGDTVRLLGLDSSPSLGRVDAVSDRWLEYQAYPDSVGTDTFRYVITDALGAQSIGTVRIGVVPKAATNTPPEAVDDHVTARPGRTVRVPVLANDSDPDGDPFGFDAPALDFPAANPATVVHNDAVAVRIGDTPGKTVGTYAIIDSRGGTATGRVTIDADPHAPLLPPVLIDDIVSAADVAKSYENKENPGVVAVPVLTNDYDPDGDITKATVTVPPYGAPPDQSATVTGTGKDTKVQVHVAATLQTIRYQVTDTDGQKAWAVITVPGRSDAVPGLRSNVRPQQVEAGKNLDLDLNDFVVGRRGRPVRLTGEDRLWATQGDGSALSATKIRFRAPLDYAGPASVTFEVTDGTSAADPDGRTAVLTIPIRVLPATNQPPTAKPVTLTVGAGEPARSVDLRKAATDPDGDRLAFSALKGDLPSGVHVESRNGVVTVQADAGAATGASFQLHGTVSDGHGGQGTTTVTVTVDQTSRRPPTAVDDSVADAPQGHPIVVPALANDDNPFPKTPLTIVAATLESGSAAVSHDASTVTITPGADFVGTVLVRYTVQDATGSPDRRSQAAIRVTVIGKPGRPGVPREVEVGNQRAVVTFTAPPDNGAPITGYTISGTGSDGSSVRQPCASTTCTIGRLTNNVRYRFSVVATNDVGDSTPSAKSGDIRPDVRPGQVATPSADWGDTTATATWTEPLNEGSPITVYQVQLSGPDGVLTRKVAGAVRTATFENLSNGGSYRFRVRAINKADRPGDWSAYSQAVVPAGPPSAPRGLTAQRVPRQKVNPPSTSSVVLRWKTPADENGAAVQTYLIYVDGIQRHSVSGGAHQATVGGLTNNKTFTFTVKAKQRGGTSRASNAVSMKMYATMAAPAAPKLTATTKGAPKVTARWSHSPGDDTGVFYQLAFNSSSTWHRLRGNPQTFASSYGRQTTARVRGCQTIGSQTACGEASKPSNQVAPYAPPNAPQVGKDESAVKSVTFSWSAPGTSNGRSIAKVQYRVNGGGWHDVGRSGSKPFGNDYGQSYTFEAREVNSAGQNSPIATITGRTNPKPIPKVVAGHGAKGSHGTNCTNSSCAYVTATLSNFLDQRNGSVTCSIEQSQDHPGWPAITPKAVSIDSRGNGYRGDMGVYGFPNDRIRLSCLGGTYKSAWITW